MAIVGNFNRDRKGDLYSGLRNYTMIEGLARRLEKHFEIERYNTDGFKADNGISRLVGKDKLDNVFVVQDKPAISIDIKINNLFYFHVDGAQNINPHHITHAFYLFNAYGIHDYKVHERQETLYPFVVPECFDPNQKKDILLSDISREVSMTDYKEQLERSVFTIINAPIWISKRAVEALACKTIPIIITDVIDMYKEFGFEDEFCMLVPKGMNIIRQIHDFKTENVELGYQWVMNNHTLDHRFDQIINVIKSYVVN